MLRRRAHRLASTFIVVLSLLFSQLALAAYTCPGQEDAAAMAAMMAAGTPCEGMDQQQPALCHEQASAAAQAPEMVKTPTPAVALVVQILTVPFTLDARDAGALPTAAAPDARPPPDPVFLSTLRLRV